MKGKKVERRNLGWCGEVEGSLCYAFGGEWVEALTKGLSF